MMNESIARLQRSEQQQRSELMELLQSIVRDEDAMRALQHMKPRSDSHPIEEMTEALQTVGYHYLIRIFYSILKGLL